MNEEIVQYRVSWEMPPAIMFVADYEDRHGKDVWPTLTEEEWNELPWAPCARVVDDRIEAVLPQFKQLSSWAESHEQPVRNVKLEKRTPAEWEEIGT